MLTAIPPTDFSVRSFWAPADFPDCPQRSTVRVSFFPQSDLWSSSDATSAGCNFSHDGESWEKLNAVSIPVALLMLPAIPPTGFSVRSFWALADFSDRLRDSSLTQRSLRLYGHVARLSAEDPAHRILSCRDPRGWSMLRGRPHASWLRQVESFLRDTGMADLASAKAMVRLRLKKYRRKVGAATLLLLLLRHPAYAPITDTGELEE